MAVTDSDDRRATSAGWLSRPTTIQQQLWGADRWFGRPVPERDHDLASQNLWGGDRVSARAPGRHDHADLSGHRCDRDDHALDEARAEVATRALSPIDVVDTDLQELFGWVVREGTTNVVRHARATSEGESRGWL